MNSEVKCTWPSDLQPSDNHKTILWPNKCLCLVWIHAVIYSTVHVDLICASSAHCSELWGILLTVRKPNKKKAGCHLTSMAEVIKPSKTWKKPANSRQRPQGQITHWAGHPPPWDATIFHLHVHSEEQEGEHAKHNFNLTVRKLTQEGHYTTYNIKCKMYKTRNRKPPQTSNPKVRAN